ncbi:MAG: T9SS type A sorting domain-containing protein [Bacteroidetes bacterium]|nr:T9SS type A sorting domain-containing protein [Bacteroidota bacterium]
MQNTGYIVGDNGKILKTIDGGTNWITQTSGTGNWLFSVYFPDATTGHAVGENGTILKTTNSVGIIEKTDVQAIKIYPNPTTGKFQLRTADSFNAKHIEVYTMLGGRVYSQMLHSPNEIVNIQLATGLYFAKAIDGEKALSIKLVIQ